MSSIRCKPSIIQSSRGSPKSQSTVFAGSAKGSMKAADPSRNMQHGGQLNSTSVIRKRFTESTGLLDDKYLYDVLLKYERYISGGLPVGHEPTAHVQVQINQPITLQIVTNERNSDYSQVCRVSIQPNVFEFFRDIRQTSFSAFGIEF